MNGGEALVETLRSRDVDAVVFVAGGTYVTVLEALSHRQHEIRAVAMRLESSAVFAAEAYAAIRRRPACVFVSRSNSVWGCLPSSSSVIRNSAR